MQWPERLSLARTPTEIVPLRGLSRRFGKDIRVWRDDLTGFGESGNKIRKLEFLLAEARAQNATEVITCGGPQSNHARATVMVARRLGLAATVMIREPREGRPQTLQGNLLLMQMAGAEIRWIPFSAYKEAGSVYTPFLEEAAAYARGRDATPYIIAEGGSSPLGTLGYAHAVDELRHADLDRAPTVVCALGSGGTHAGLVLGYDRLGYDPERVFAVNVCDDRAYFENRVGNLIDETVDRFGMNRPRGDLRILDGYVGDGYARTRPEELLFYMKVLREEGIWLDPVYTGKAFLGMVSELEKDPSPFGDTIVFLHSGGQMANFAFAKEYAELL